MPYERVLLGMGLVSDDFKPPFLKLWILTFVMGRVGLQITIPVSAQVVDSIDKRQEDVFELDELFQKTDLYVVLLARVITGIYPTKDNIEQGTSSAEHCSEETQTL